MQLVERYKFLLRNLLRVVSLFVPFCTTGHGDFLPVHGGGS